MMDLGKVLLVVGLVVAVLGVLLVVAGRWHLPVGKLPGDFVYRGKNTTVYFPLGTSIVVSVVLSAVLYLIGRMR